MNCARRKRADVQYIRHESTFVILATKGVHLFFEEEANLNRDIRVPLHYAGYSISCKPGGRTKGGRQDDKLHADVAMDRNQFLELRSWFAERTQREFPERLALAVLPIAGRAIRPSAAAARTLAQRGQPSAESGREKANSDGDLAFTTASSKANWPSTKANKEPQA